MNKKVLKNVIIAFITIVCLSFAIDIEALSHAGNNACYGFNGGRAATGCNPVANSADSYNPKQDTPRLYTIDCLSCSGWNVAYDACDGVTTTTIDSGLQTEKSFSTMHEQCKLPLVGYRTYKGKSDLTTTWNRCDTIVDETKTECDIVEGNACAGCTDKCCQWPTCTWGNQTISGPLCGDCQKWGVRCTGVSADGVALPDICMCSCSECYQLNHDLHSSIFGRRVGALIEAHFKIAARIYEKATGTFGIPGQENADWANGRLGGAVNAFCTTSYRTSYLQDTCNKRGVKVSPNVCQQRYVIIPENTTVTTADVNNGRYEAYCINPGQAAAERGIQWDKAFDATTCETSLSTINCGYANILIEGYLRKELGRYGDNYYQVISTAMQLWGAHADEAGYQTPGFSPESVIEEEDPGTYTFDLPDTRVPNCDEVIRKTRFSLGIDLTGFDDYANAYYHPATYLRFMYHHIDSHTGERVYRNIFRETSDNIDNFNEYIEYDSIYDVKSYVDVTGVEYGSISGRITEEGLKAIECSKLIGKDRLGYCGTGSASKEQYLEALYLYANTIQGNRLMQTHLKQLLALKDENVNPNTIGNNNNPESIDTSYNKATKELSITYKMANKGNHMNCREGAVLNEVPVCCTSGDDECKFLQNSITLSTGGSPIVLRWNNNDSNPNNDAKYDYCLNGYCYLTINLSGYSNADSICENRALFDIVLDVSEAKSAIKRYEPKNGSESDRQSYFAFDYSHNYDDDDNSGLYNTEVVCNGCKNNPTVKTGYLITDAAVAQGNFSSKEDACLKNNSSAVYDFETGLCYVSVANNEPKTLANINNKCINCIVNQDGDCITSEGNIFKLDESINSRRISDPSLNCILNMSRTEENMGKSYYDYSDTFGVNTDVCRIYCSDEVNIFLANKKDIYVGMNLQYDIESQVEQVYGVTPKTNRKGIFKNGKSDGLKLSAIIMQERKCVSKIYYDDILYDYSRDWSTVYNFSSETAAGITNWKKLYSALENYAKNENLRRENLNQLLYDLYNCNLMNPQEISQASNNKVRKPVDRNNVYEYMISLYKTIDSNKPEESEAVTVTIPKPNNGVESIKDHRCSNGPCSELTDLRYFGGAQYIPNHFDDQSSRVGQVTGEPEISYYTSSNADLDGTKPIKILYCDKDSCFGGELVNQYSGGTNKNTYLEDYLAAQDPYPENDFNIDFSKWNLSNEIGLKSVKDETGDDRWSGALIPTRDYAIFTIQIRTDYYNSEEYQSEYYTGRVKKHDSSDHNKYVKLDKFIYPISLDAFQDLSCMNVDDGFGNKEGTMGSCKTEFAFNINPDTTRKNPADKFTQYLKGEKAATTYICNYISRSEPIREGIVYRSIGLDDPFPNKGSRPAATNWMNEIGKRTIREIKESANDIYRVNKEYLEYQFTFTKKALEEIKNSYNYENDVRGVGYSGIDTIQNCKKAFPETYKYSVDFQSEENGTIYVQCESTFLNDLVEGKFEGVTYGKTDGISEHTQKEGLAGKIMEIPEEP